jgi:hypothetical protein
LVRQLTDWEYLLQLARRHRVAALVSHVLKQIDNSEVPGPVLSQVRAASRVSAGRNLQLTSGLVKLLDLFAANSIPAVAYRGPVLASSLYGRVVLREFSDLDVLIRREDVARTKDLLVAHGYRTDLPTDRAREAAYLRSRHELHFMPDDDAFLIEIHQAFLAPYHSFRFDYDALWSRLRRTRFYDREILTLAPEDQLLVLSVHAAKHSWSLLGWICDIARLLVVSGEEVDWTTLMDRAASFGASRMVSLGLVLAHSLLAAPVPAVILEHTEEDERVGYLANTVISSLFDGGSTRSELRSHLFFLRARERLRDKLMYCSRLAFSPTEEDHSIVHLPAVLMPLYYPLHAVRVAGKYGLGALRTAI